MGRNTGEKNRQPQEAIGLLNDRHEQVKNIPKYNVAILGDHYNWSGGMDFVRLLVNALVQDDQGSECKVTILFSKRYCFHGVREAAWSSLRVFKDIILKRQLMRYNRQARKPFLDLLSHIDGNYSIESYDGRQESMLSALKRSSSHVILGVIGSFEESFPIPWVSYIYDFQHKYYPDFFSSEECLNRDIAFDTILRDSRATIVNSQAACRDIAKFFPYSPSRIFSLPFAAAPSPQWFEPSHEDLFLKYKLPKRYFIICNQFWIHKAHITAFEALRDLLARKGDAEYCHIVCTGKADDNRQPEYFKELKAKIKSNGIQDRIHFLGFIPKIDQIQIMKEAIAVIQPTFFEGGPGGGSVYDAVAMGVPAIISDIPVNREISAEAVRFFPVGSVVALSKAMEAVAENPPTHRAKDELIEDGQRRTRQLRQTLIEAIDYVLGSAACP